MSQPVAYNPLCHNAGPSLLQQIDIHTRYKEKIGNTSFLKNVLVIIMIKMLPGSP